MNNELIVVKQLPIIEERLQDIKSIVEEKITKVLSLVVTEETVKDIKKLRTELGKEFKGFEDKRKEIKKAINEPYERFEKTYDECVSRLYKEADARLKESINSVEQSLKEEKKKEVEEYFNEYAESLGIDFMNFADSNIKIDMTVTKKKLKEQAKSVLDKVSEDLKMIYLQEDAAEILYEYKKCFDVVRAMTIVTERRRSLAMARPRVEEHAPIPEEPKEKIQAPKEIDDTVYPLQFTVYGTKEQLKELKNYIIGSGLRYE